MNSHYVNRGGIYGELDQSRYNLDEIFKRAVEIGGGKIFRNDGIGKEYQEAYDKWMHLRAATGNKFAISLGY